MNVADAEGVVAFVAIAQAAQQLGGAAVATAVVQPEPAAAAYVAFQVDDAVVFSLALAGIGATLGFFIWNFPAGLIFLGDGGAYFLGFWFAELSILLLVRNPDGMHLLR